MDEKFDARQVAFKEKIRTRSEGLEEFDPQIIVEVYPVTSSRYGPIMMTFDLLHRLDPKQSKPQAFRHLTPSQALQVSASLLRAYKTATGNRLIMREILDNLRLELGA